MIYIMTFKILKVIKVKLTFKRQIDYKGTIFKTLSFLKGTRTLKILNLNFFSILDHTLIFFKKI